MLETHETLAIIRELEDIGITDRKKQDAIIALILPFKQRHDDDIYETEQRIIDEYEELDSAIDNMSYTLRNAKQEVARRIEKRRKAKFCTSSES